MSRKLRLGIDVGGTFTDVVAIDAATRVLLAHVKVPTTHAAAEGVAAGIIAGINQLLAQANIAPSEVAFIAHSTTQATNALLEGDVAPVGVLGLLDGLQFPGRKRDALRLNPAAWLARKQMAIAPITLAPGATFAPQTVFARARDERSIHGAIDALHAAGAHAIAVTHAFGVDRPQTEAAAVNYARGKNLLATCGHDVSSMYGLRARTRTAALNAAILPTMVRTARMTADAVARATINAPLMIMRSDGGVMDVREVERRPILTMLSGPAAGVAGALLYENITDGIFIEVGGTSSDCSAIRAGTPQMRPARVGGFRTMLRTLDVRTFAIAGGSMARIDAHGITDVGPRSAHIAGCAYASFVKPAQLEGARVECIAPAARDPYDYVVLVTRDGTRVALTPTCASNFLDFVPQHEFARGNKESTRIAFTILAKHLNAEPESLARQLLDCASEKLSAGIENLLEDYQLERERIVLVGGGGGAAALVPYAAQRLGIRHTIARDAEVISPIGVALALVRDVVERTIVNPSAEDIVKIRREASDRVIAAGAAPDRIEVSVEIDTRRNRVRATASGATALAESAAHGERSETERRAIAATSLGVPLENLKSIAQLDGFTLFETERQTQRRFLKTITTKELRIVDDRGIVRLGLKNARIAITTVQNLETTLRNEIENATSFGDVGRALPNVYILHGGRLADFCGLASTDQAAALAQEETTGRDGDAQIAIITAPGSP